MKFIRNILKNSRSVKDGNFFLQLEKILGFKPKDQGSLCKSLYSSIHEYKGQNGECAKL